VTPETPVPETAQLFPEKAPGDPSTGPESRAVVVDVADLRAVLDEFVPTDPRLGSGATDRLRAALGRPRGSFVRDEPGDVVSFQRRHLRALTDWIDQSTVPHGLPADVAVALQTGCDTVDGVPGGWGIR